MLSNQSIVDIERLLTQGEATPALIRALKQDPRKGVQVLYRRWLLEQQKLKAERERLQNLLAFDTRYRPARGLLAGVDEAGRGPLAGPVVAAAVILPADAGLPPGTDDSKKLPARKREILARQLKEIALCWSVGIVPPQVIDEINIHRGTLRAMQKALSGLKTPPAVVLVDGLYSCDFPVSQIKVVKGDRKSASIAAASIIAKVERDNLMREYAEKFPQYGFEKHFGYPTEMHRLAIREHGVSPVHRKSFAGVKEWV